MRVDERATRTAVFLDRDGVINRKPADGEYVRSWAEFELIPGAIQALRSLSDAGAVVLIVTNQRGVARGVVRNEALDDVHGRIRGLLNSAGVALGGIYVCPHDVDSCECRKPQAGLFMQAREDQPWINLAESHMIGDSLSDMQAGHRLGMTLWLVGDAPQRRDVENKASADGIQVQGNASSLAELVADRDILRALTDA